MIVATVLTEIIGEIIIKAIEKTVFRHTPQAEIEDLFSHLELIAPALIVAGLLILVAGVLENRKGHGIPVGAAELKTGQAGLIGAVQGLCLPFRGLSRSGTTISAGMLAGVAKEHAENFSFALAVVLTPVVVAREGCACANRRHSPQHGFRHTAQFSGYGLRFSGGTARFTMAE